MRMKMKTKMIKVQKLNLKVDELIEYNNSLD